MNNPLNVIDPDGKQVRIYAETKGLGHVFVTTGEGKNTTVYTYGRYGALDKDKSSARSTTPIGEGILIKLQGNDAKEYVTDQIENKNARVYEISGGDEEKTNKHFDSKLESSDKSPSEGKYAGEPNAKVVDQYNLFGSNCVTTSLDGVKSGVEKRHSINKVKAFTPSDLTSEFAKLKSLQDQSVKEIDKGNVIKKLNP